MTAILHNKVILNVTTNVTATSSWIPVDFRASVPQPCRSIFGSRSNPSDVFQVMVRNVAFDAATSAQISVTATATVFASGPALFQVDIIAPVSHIRVVKQGAAGTARVVGII